MANHERERQGYGREHRGPERGWPDYERERAERDWGRSDLDRDERRGFGGYGGESRGREWEREGYGRMGQGREWERGGYGGYASGRQGWGEQGGYRGMEPGRGEQESGYGRMGQGREWERGGYGPHAGRGPKGYTRSDERIQEDICERLTQHPAIDASDIEIEVKNGEVTLRGTVESRAVKHLVENMVETVTGVKDVHNQLRVAQFQQQGGQAPTPGGQTQGAQPQGQKR